MEACSVQHAANDGDGARLEQRVLAIVVVRDLLHAASNGLVASVQVLLKLKEGEESSRAFGCVGARCWSVCAEGGVEE
eukprot:356488-Chlamydomonas_euryale.AAC.3